MISIGFQQTSDSLARTKLLLPFCEKNIPELGFLRYTVPPLHFHFLPRRRLALVRVHSRNEFIKKLNTFTSTFKACDMYLMAYW